MPDDTIPSVDCTVNGYIWLAIRNSTELDISKGSCLFIWKGYKF